MPFPDEIEILPTSRVDGLDAGDETPGSVEVGPHSEDHNNVNRIVNELQQLVLDLLAAPAPSGGGGGPIFLPENLIATTIPQMSENNGNSGANTIYGARAYAHKSGTLHNLWLVVNSCFAVGKIRGAVYSGAGARLWLGPEQDTYSGLDGWMLLGDPNLPVTKGDQFFFSFAATVPVQPVAANVSGGNTLYMPSDLVPSGNGYMSFQAGGQYPPPASANFSTWAGLSSIPCLVAKIT